jgi:hypothetical protein
MEKQYDDFDMVWTEWPFRIIKPEKQLTEKQLFDNVKKELKTIANRTSAAKRGNALS